MVAGTVERIQVIVQSMTAGFARGLNRAQKQLRSTGKHMHQFGQVMALPIQNFQKMNKANVSMINSGARFANGIRTMTHGMRGFRMEMLGVMFFGMAMQKMFMGLLRPVLEAFGVFELFRVMLMVLFIPMMIELNPWLIKIATNFMNLDESTQKLIGNFTLVGLALGIIIGTIGVLALGIGSLILVFGGIVPALLMMGGIAIAMIAIGAIVFGLFQMIQGKWEGLGIIITAVGVILAFFIGIWALIPIVVGAAVFLIIKHWDKITEFFSGLWDGWLESVEWWKDKIVGIFEWLYNKLVGRSIIPDMINAILDWFWKIPKSVLDMFESIIDKMFQIGKDIFQGMVDGIESMAKAVKDAILGLFPAWARALIWSAGKFIINIFSRKKSSDTSSDNGGSFDDFIWRPGQSPISINPKDTLVGFKGSPPGLGREITIQNTYNVVVSDKEEFERILREHDSRLLSQIERNT